MPNEQFHAPAAIKLHAEDFAKRPDTAVYWLGSAGVLINSRGTLLLVDAVIGLDADDPTKSETGHRLLVQMPVLPQEIPHLDGVLYTHADFDHLGVQSAPALMHTGAQYHGTGFVANTLRQLGVDGDRVHAHTIGETFQIGCVSVTLTEASHSWQKAQPEKYNWSYGPTDCCGFLITTPDGVIWIPGDSKLLDVHFTYAPVDLLFLDLSQDAFHFGLDNAIALANHYENADLIMYHYGTYDAPDKPFMSADPASADGRLLRPERFFVLAPGKQFILRR